MVGSRAVGNWPDNQNEGWSGYTIAGLQAKIPEAVKLRPNAILLHIGTNDAGQTSDVNTLPGQLGNMIDSLFSGCPDAFVLVAKIIRSGNAGTQARVITYNNAIDGVVASRRNAGKHILVVDMFPVLPPSDIQDGIHPNDAGYQKMANVWLDGIRQANANGWIGTPATLTSPTAPVVSGGGRQQCKTSLFWYPANLNAAANEVATGAGYGSDVFPGITCSDVQSDATPKQCFCSDSTTVFFKGDTAACSDFSIPYIHAMHMVDMNGDGRADFVHVGDRGQVKAYYNFRDPNDNADKIVWRDQGGES